MGDIRGLWGRFYDRLSGNTYKKRLREMHQELESTPTPHWDLKVPTTDILNELQETKRTATGILESLIKRSESDRRRMELIFDELSDAIILTSEDGTITAANLMMRSLFGAQTSKLIGRPISEFFPRFSSEILAAESVKYLTYLEEIIGAGEVCTNPLAFKQAYAQFLRQTSRLLNHTVFEDYTRSDGARLHLSLTANILTLEPCAPEFNYIFVIRDLTEQRKVESEVAHLRSVASSLMSVTQVPVFYKGLDLKFTDVNKPFRDLLDVVESDVVGKTVDHVFDSDSAEKLTELDERALNSEHAHRIDVDLKTLRGVVRSARVVSKAVRSGAGVTGLAGSIITNETPDAETRNAIFTAASKAIVFLDSEHRVTGCNDEFVRLAGQDKNALIGVSLLEGPLSYLMLDTPLPAMESDIIEHKGLQLCRVYVPITRGSGIQTGFVYIFFVPSDN